MVLKIAVIFIIILNIKSLQINSKENLIYIQLYAW